MAENSPKRSGELVRKVFEILMGHPDGMRAKNVLHTLENAVSLNPAPLRRGPAPRRSARPIPSSRLPFVSSFRRIAGFEDRGGGSSSACLGPRQFFGFSPPLPA